MRFLLSTSEDFLHFCEVSEAKVDRNECAEGAQDVKRPFPDPKKGKGYVKRAISLQTPIKKLPGYKKCINLVDPLGGGGVSRKAKILSLGNTFFKIFTGIHPRGQAAPRMFF